MQRAATTPELFAAPVEPKAEVAVAESPLQELPPPSSALTQMESSLAAGGRPIAVWVVDRTVRRSTVLRQIAQSIEKRIKSSLAQDGLPQPLIEVVCSFAAMFLPPLPQQAQSPITPGSVPGPRSPMHGVSVIANAPYLTEPDEMADSFQDFFASVRTQIATAQTDKSLEDAGETLDQQAEADQLDAYLERVESVVCEEVYDR